MCYFVVILNNISDQRDFMKKIILNILISIFLFSCNDGDIIVTSFDFDEASLSHCGGPGGYVFYKINNESAESISLNLGTSDVLFLNAGSRIFELDGDFNIVHYRKYNDALSNDYFCSEVPPTQPQVTNEFIGESGDAILLTTVVLDDQDEIEEDPLSDLDTDNDSLLNYFDNDDDGDNVPTIIELGIDYINGITEFPLDTDGDTIFNFLDDDDDNDGILTRNEDFNEDLDPTNDITDISVGADYLNPDIVIETVINEFREHSYHLNSSISLTLSNLVLMNGEEQITQESMNLGSIENIEDLDVLITPAFPD